VWFPFSWHPVQRLLAQLSICHNGSHGFPHSPATPARLLNILAKSMLHSLSSELLSVVSICTAVRGLVPTREVWKVAMVLKLFLDWNRACVLTFIIDVAFSTCRLPNVVDLTEF
jgi:hypothetical protein